MRYIQNSLKLKLYFMYMIKISLNFKLFFSRKKSNPIRLLLLILLFLSCKLIDYCKNTHRCLLHLRRRQIRMSTRRLLRIFHMLQIRIDRSINLCLIGTSYIMLPLMVIPHLVLYILVHPRYFLRVQQQRYLALAITEVLLTLRPNTLSCSQRLR
jgi:hypothetical protein